MSTPASNPPNPVRDVVIVGGSLAASTTARATAAAPAYTEGTDQPISQTLDGGLRISGTINATSAAKANAADPSLVEASSNPFSTDLAGYQRVKAKQSGTWTVGVDQTTPGVTNAVDVTNFPVTVDTNSGVKSANTIRVVLATDQPQLTASLKVDGSGVTQPVSGTFWQATQPVSGTFWQATQPVSGTFWQATQPVSLASAITADQTAATPVLENALSTTVQTVNGSASKLMSYYVYNPNASVAYVQIFDISGTVTLGTSTPKWSIGIPPSSAANLSNLNMNFANAIKVAATTTATGSTAPGTALDANFTYR